MNSLRSAPLAPLADDDHLRGEPDWPLVIEYADFECPICALLEARVAELRLRRVFRHFPVRSKHPRAWPAACAAEAAACQGAFWAMHDSLFGDPARLEDPHLWRRVAELGLDLERFEEDRRSTRVAARVRRDFEAGVRVGVVTTPTLYFAGGSYSGAPNDELLRTLGELAG